MNSCGRQRFRVGDGVHPGGQMKLCVSYVGDWNNMKGKVRYIKISDRV